MLVKALGIYCVQTVVLQELVEGKLLSGCNTYLSTIWDETMVKFEGFCINYIWCQAVQSLVQLLLSLLMGEFLDYQLDESKNETWEL